MGKPKIRFKGYEDDWEQRKLEEYLGVSKEKNRDESFGKDDFILLIYKIFLEIM